MIIPEVGNPIDADQLLDERDLSVVDVRSPGEYQRGHIPGAVNLPLFDDDERAEVGTLYRQQGQKRAVDRGFEIASGKSDQLVRALRENARESRLALHCWRGGMRSRGVAWLCKDCGLKPKLLVGGYKAFRRKALGEFQQSRKIILLAGQTGAGKTRLLGLLREAGQQVIDLEALANHTGSVFGGIEREPQPTVEQFENDLFLQWRGLDPNQPVWIEGESQSIGRVHLPQPLWQQMSAAPMIFVDVNRQARIEFLLQDYGQLPASELATAVQRLKKRLGGLRLQAALDAVDRDDYRQFASIVLEYYDKAYLNSLSKRPVETVKRVPVKYSGDPAAIETLLELAQHWACVQDCEGRREPTGEKVPIGNQGASDKPGPHGTSACTAP